MSHFDYISKVAPGFEISSHTKDCPCASAENADKKLYAIQFHPEVLHTQEGTKMLYNFVRGVCQCSGEWRMDSFVDNQLRQSAKKLRWKSIVRIIRWCRFICCSSNAFKSNWKTAYMCICRLRFTSVKMKEMK